MRSEGTAQTLRVRPWARAWDRVLIRRAVLTDGPMATALLAVAIVHVVMFAATGVLRAIYPYPIDGIEPGAIQEVRRVLAGQPIYVAPELGYVPFIYGPVYFFVSALFAAASGSVLMGMRLVSLLASLGAIALVTTLVRRETGSLLVGVVAGGVLAGCGPLVDFALDIGRMDALFVFILLASTYVARLAIQPSATWRCGVISGALMGLALLTKQSGIPVLVAFLLLFAVIRPYQLAPFSLALVAVVGLVVVLLVAQSGRWALFYVWDLPRRHEIWRELILRIFPDILSRFTLPLVVGPFFLFGQFLVGDRRRLIFYATASAGLAGTAWTSYSNVGGARNVLLPAYAALAILFALGLHEALSRLPVGGPAGPIRGYVFLIGIAQLLVLLYNPRLIVPYRSDRWDGERLTATLANLPGPIFAGSYQGFVTDSSMVAPDLGAVRELEGAFGGTGTPEGSDWEGMLAGALAQRRFTYLIVDPDNSASIVPLLADAYGYERVGWLFPEGDVYWAWRTGWAPKADLYVKPQGN
ncbi:MAG: hypothetical protein NVSMB2_09010 [Chloroflexota bacterium]